MITQVEPVTQLQRKYQTVIDKAANGPVILSQAGRAAAVVLSVAEFDRMRSQIATYERQFIGDRAVQADEWLTDDDVTAAFNKAGVTL